MNDTDRFKFRVWDKVYNEFLIKKNERFFRASLLDVVSHASFDFYQTTKNEKEYSSLSFCIEKPEFIVMQCTGLKDKNEKLIYEGDIIKFPYFMSWSQSSHPGYTDMQTNYDMCTGVGVVIFDKEKCRYVIKSNHCVYEHDTWETFYDDDVISSNNCGVNKHFVKTTPLTTYKVPKNGQFIYNKEENCLIDVDNDEFWGSGNELINCMYELMVSRESLKEEVEKLFSKDEKYRQEEEWKEILEWNKLEIIGNVYENPELLEKNNAE